MRLNTSKKVHYDAGPNMTPLVDVVMVILIFLMLVGSFGGAEWYLLTDQMVATNGPGTTTDAAPKTKLVIRITQSGSNYIVMPARLPTITSATGQDEAFSALSAELKSAYDKYAGVGNADDVQIEIIPDQTVPLSSVVAVFSACNEAGFKKIGFGV